MNQGVPYNQFNDWFRKIHKKILPVQIDDIPSADEGSAKEAKPKIVKEKGHIMVLIYNCDGLQIKKKILCYPKLKQLVEKLEDLC